MNDRHQRVESLLRELVAEFIRNEANPNPLITITRVTASPDCRNATVFFTTIPEDREQDALIFMKRSAGNLRTAIKKHSRLKTIPHFIFLIDQNERIRQFTDGISQAE